MLLNPTPGPAFGRSNEQWLQALRSADADALRDLLDTLRRGLGRSLGRREDVNEEDLEDFAQEAVWRVLAQFDSFQGNSRFTTWAMAVAVRVGLNHLRKRSWGHRSLEQALEAQTGAPPHSTAQDPGRAAARKDLLAALERAVEESLTERQRTLIRAELAGMPGEEIVKLLGTNHNALYKLYHDARKKLQRALNEAGFSDADVRRELDGTSDE